MSPWTLIPRGATSRFARAALDPRTRLVCVDVFDTLLLRGLRPETVRFEAIGARQLEQLAAHGFAPQHDAGDLLHLRLLVARAAYRNAPAVCGVREASYDDIARVLCRALGLPRDAEALLRSAELACEAGALRPNQQLVGILRRCRAAGKTVVAISDMYLRGEDIGGLVRRLVPDLALDAVYSSADARVTKASGLLFERIAGERGVAPAEIVHCGDSRTVDGEGARKAGVRAFLLPRALPLRIARAVWLYTFALRRGLT